MLTYKTRWVILDYMQGALDYADERSSAGASGPLSSPSSGQSESAGQGPLIFLHAGNYRGEFLVIDSDIALIGKQFYYSPPPLPSNPLSLSHYN